MNDVEIEVIIKTKKENFEKIKKEVERLHPYETPQIIALSSSNVNNKYLQWLDESTKTK